MTYSSALEYLYNRLPVFHQIGSSAYKPGLDNTIRFLNEISNPQNKFITIHVAGTNGKGSVSHMLSAIFQAAGFKTGLYTSPHLVDFGERIRINGEMIHQDYVVDFVENYKDLFDKIEPSFFEATMAMSFKYFADNKVDIAIVEVGLGGRLDSTNIIQPVVSVITNISFDHVEFLGNTLEKIAYEKAGIIKKNTPVVIGEWDENTRPVFESKAHEMNSPLYKADQKTKILNYEDSKMVFQGDDGKKYISGLTGIYQLKNLSTVFRTIEVINKLGKFETINENNIRQGLENVISLTGLRGRWEVIATSPMIVADTGHNVSGITCVVDQLQLQKYDHLHIVIGMVNDKDITHVLQLLPKDATYYFTQAQVKRAFPSDKLKDEASKYSLKGNAYSTIKEAIDSAVKNAMKSDFILIGGSNFVVGEALTNWK